jgi:hypothetical protein
VTHQTVSLGMCTEGCRWQSTQCQGAKAATLIIPTAEDVRLSTVLCRYVHTRYLSTLEVAWLPARLTGCAQCNHYSPCS